MLRYFRRYRKTTHFAGPVEVTVEVWGPWASHALTCKCNVCR
jgi:hypothetical protein